MKTVQEYLEAPSRCPVCDSEDIEAVHVPSGPGGRAGLYQGMECHSCGSGWDDEYSVTNFTLTRRGEGQV